MTEAERVSFSGFEAMFIEHFKGLEKQIARLSAKVDEFNSQCSCMRERLGVVEHRIDGVEGECDELWKRSDQSARSQVGDLKEARRYWLRYFVMTLVTVAIALVSGAVAYHMR